MPGVRGIRGTINIEMNRLVREGVISGFRSNFDFRDKADLPHVIVTVPDGRSREDVRVLVLNAMAAVAVDIDIRVERG